MSKQLLLPVNLHEHVSFDNFLVGDNAQVVRHLKSLLLPNLEQRGSHWLNVISAPSGHGKSHLLFALVNLAHENQLNAAYLSFNDKHTLMPSMLEGLESFDLICLDDIEQLTDDLAWQIALFDLINRVKEVKTSKLVLCSGVPLPSLNIQLPDLSSRLNWGLSFRLKTLNEVQRLRALQMRAEQRGLHLPTEVAKFLMNRHQRDLSALIASLDTLDEVSLSQQRKLTIPFVKSVFDV
ncbi:MAG: DnaA regulatory inactivator Hda [Paraglaciecola sp.]|nr:DnaA regulatory inactivator Hda [Paraglaciecola sp.]NCT47054.1 DnaA regulatory inactivator Hda [Paraglaciecola sp.]